MRAVRLVLFEAKGISRERGGGSASLSGRAGCTMTYAVKEIFKTLQGEGAQAGRAAIFCRFACCNLWSGREEDRTGPKCRFCGTDFVGLDGTLGGRYASAEQLAEMIARTWDGPHARRFVVLTGGEPLL